MTEQRSALRLLEFGINWPPETFIRARLERLAERGVEITVAAPASAQGDPRVPGIEVLPVLPEGPGRRRTTARGLMSLALLALRRPRLAVALLHAARRSTAAGRPIAVSVVASRLLAFARLARARPDVIHFEWLSAAADYHAFAAALGCRAVMSCRGELRYELIVPSRRYGRATLAALWPRMAAVHCVAEAIRDQAVLAGADPGRTSVIRHGVDLKQFRPPELPRAAGEVFSVLCVGNLRWLKGHEDALLAFVRLLGVGVPARLEIIGADPIPALDEESQRDRVLRVAGLLGVDERVRLAGDPGPLGVRDAMQRADVLLHTSLTEGLPVAVLEAMASGLPVVATDVGGTREALTDGVEGFLVRPRDHQAAATRLAELWHDPALRRRMGQAGRARVQERFDPERGTEQWLALYGRVVAHG